MDALMKQKTGNHVSSLPLEITGVFENILFASPLTNHRGKNLKAIKEITLANMIEIQHGSM